MFPFLLLQQYCAMCVWSKNPKIIVGDVRSCPRIDYQVQTVATSEPQSQVSHQHLS